jgi:hypothetical protein
MMNKFLLVLVLGVFSVGAQGATIYSQTPVSGGGLISDADPFFLSFTQYAADDFMLVNTAIVTSVLWRGVEVGTPAPDNFTINFYTGISNPDVLLQSFSIGTPSSRSGTFIFEYVADLGTGISLSSDTTYWISIFNNTAGDADQNFWAWNGNPSVSTGAKSVISDDLLVWSSVTGGGEGQLSEEQYFQLTDNVPIPPTVWLLGSALGLLGWMKRRKTH